MELTQNFCKILQQSLRDLNKNSVYLNALPRSGVCIDFENISYQKSKSSKIFLKSLLQGDSLKISIQEKEHSTTAQTEEKRKSNKLITLFKKIDEKRLVKGINTFGFGYPLLVCKSSIVNQKTKEKELIIAPLFLWNLKHEESFQKNSWIIQSSENEIQFNPVLREEIKLQIGERLDEILKEFDEEKELSESVLLKICNELKSSFQTKEEASSILQNEIYENLSVENIPSKSELDEKSNKGAEIIWSGILGNFDSQRQSIINEYDYLLSSPIQLKHGAIDNHNFQTLSSIGTDPYQQKILRSLNSNRNIIIHGPPGTGKSRTLSAVIINALENKKTVLVVCEKQAALNVLYKELSKEKLEPLLVNIKDEKEQRKVVVEKLRSNLARHKFFEVTSEHSENLDFHVLQANEKIKSINKIHLNISEPLLGDKNWSRIVGDFLKNRLPNRAHPFELEFDSDLLDFQTNELKQLRYILDDGEPLYHDAKPFLDSCPLNHLKFLSENHFALKEEFRNDLLRYQDEITDLKKLYQKFTTEASKEIEKRLLTDFSTLNKQTSEIINFYNQNIDDKDFMQLGKTKTQLYQFLSFFSPKKRALLKDQGECLELYKAVTAFANKINSLYLVPSLSNSPDKIYPEIQQLGMALRPWVSNWERFIQQEIRNLQVNSGARKYDSFLLLENRWNEFKEKLKHDDWFPLEEIDDSLFSDAIESLEILMEQSYKLIYNNKSAFEKLHKYVNFSSKCNPKESKIIDAIKSYQGWSQVFSFYYYHKILTKAKGEIRKIDDRTYKQLVDEFENINTHQPNSILHYWINKQKRLVGEFNSRSDFKVKNLYNFKKSEKHPRYSLREIIEYDLPLFQSFFPIVLTTPRAACSMFGGNYSDEIFDLVLFDEASQLTVEETFPLLLKGKQRIISGDENQMQPTHFFKKKIKEIKKRNRKLSLKEALENDLLDSISLLDFGKRFSFEEEYLKIHYRSEHPALFNFSNHAFYDGSLLPIPKKRDYVPIFFEQVNGNYSNSTNKDEAKAIVNNICEMSIDRVNPQSILIATFSENQQDEILEAIKEKINTDEEENDIGLGNLKFHHNNLKVLNLENLQGDEADIVFISTTYGKNGNDFSRNFGPLIKRNGAQRLNVIVTRAKKEVRVFTSIPVDEYENYQTLYEKEKKINRVYFYAYLSYAKAVSKKDTDAVDKVISFLDSINESKLQTNNHQVSENEFQDEVFNFLSNDLPKYEIEKNFPVAGFKADIIIKLENSRYPPIVLECDGSKNHTSEEAYLFDEYRKELFEKNGFVFYRIWSVDWWDNFERELDNLIQFIREKLPIESNSVSTHRKNIIGVTKTKSATIEFEWDLKKNS